MPFINCNKFLLPVEVYSAQESLSAPQLTGPSKIYIGGVHVAKNIEALKESKIQIIINCTYSSPCYYENDFQYLRVPLADDVHQELGSAITVSAKFIQEKGLGKNVLIHCTQGISRSVSIAVAWLITYKNLGLVKSLELIQSRHPIAEPNMGFLQELSDYEAKMHGEDKCELLRTCKACSKLIVSDVQFVFPGCGHSICKSCKSLKKKQRLCAHCLVESKIMKKSQVRRVSSDLGKPTTKINPAEYLPLVR